VDAKRGSLRSSYIGGRVLCLWAASLCSGALPPDPTNAALLYYQAFLLCPEADSAMSDLIHEVVVGGDPNERVREYLKEYQSAIRYAEKAVQVADCDWGLWYSLGYGYRVPSFDSMRSLSRILHVDARVLAADGDYRAAFARCLMMRRIARHIDTETVDSCVHATEIEGLAERCICQILGSMPADVEIITWLKSQLAAVPGVPLAASRALRVDFELVLQMMRTHHDTTMTRVRQRLAEATGNESAQKAQYLSDEELLAYLRKPYTEFLDSALPVIDSTTPFPQAYAEIERLIGNLKEKIDNDPVGRIAATGAPIMADSVLGFYSSRFRSVARRNAFSVALDVFLERAKTGRLPERLPRGVAKDPYTGQDFVYTINEEGFVLRCPFTPPNERGIIRFVYPVRQRQDGMD
jgi:hypothetical protein